MEFGLEHVEDPHYFDSLLRTALDLPQRFMALRAVGHRGRRDHIDLLREELCGSDALSRGCAALAPARLFDEELVRAAYLSAAEPAEWVFAAWPPGQAPPCTNPGDTSHQPGWPASQPSALVGLMVALVGIGLLIGRPEDQPEERELDLLLAVGSASR